MLELQLPHAHPHSYMEEIGAIRMRERVRGEQSHTHLVLASGLSVTAFDYLTSTYPIFARTETLS